MHTASYEFLMKPKKSAGCHQTLSARVASGDETRLKGWGVTAKYVAVLFGAMLESAGLRDEFLFTHAVSIFKLPTA